MSTKRLPDSLKEASEFQLSNITNDTFIPLFTKSGNTEVMKKIKANVLNNGGGSISTPQPNRVIIIDTTLEQNIEGKAYKTFAEAKTYMENHFGFYQVELPAGDFDEQITLEFGETYPEQRSGWIIHGNNTTITQPLISNFDIKTNEFLGILPTLGCFYTIKDCDIDGGFAVTQQQLSEAKCPIFHISDCRILSFQSIDAQDEAFPSLLCDKCCVGDFGAFDESENIDAVAVFATNSICNGCNIIFGDFLNCVINNGINCYNAIIVNSVLNNFATDDGVYENESVIIDNTIKMINCAGHTIRLNSHSDKAAASVLIKDCNITKIRFSGTFEIPVEIEDSKIIYSFPDYESEEQENLSLTMDIRNGDITISGQLNNTNIIADSNSSVCIQSLSSINQLNCSANTIVTNGNLASINNQPKQYKYLSNGSMTDDPSGATHIGLLKEINKIFDSAVENTDYIWIPLNNQQ